MSTSLRLARRLAAALLVSAGPAACATAPAPAPVVAPRVVRDSAAAEREYGRAKALVAEGRHADALAHFAAALAADPTYGLVYIDKAEAHLYADDDLAEQHRLLVKAVELLPDSARARLRLGGVLSRTERVAEAVAEWQTAVKLRPDLVEAHMALASGLEQLGRPDEARRALEDALRYEPKNVQARVRLGQVFERLGRHDDAALQVEIAADFVQKSAPLYRRAGELYAAAGRSEDANRMRAKADRLDPPKEARKYRELRRGR